MNSGMEQQMHELHYYFFKKGSKMLTMNIGIFL